MAEGFGAVPKQSLAVQAAKQEVELEKSIATLPPGRHGLGDNLWLEVTTKRSWSFRYMVGGRARQMGLGSWPAVSLKDARAALLEARKALNAGQDPIDLRRSSKAAK